MDKSIKLLLENGIVVNEGVAAPGWIAVDEDGIISGTGLGDAPEKLRAEADECRDLSGKWVFPGVIDVHVHFRDPGLTEKGDMASESEVAVKGGITTFFDMPNTVPPTVTVEAWKKKMERAAESSRANYAFYIGATNNNLEELLKADYTRTPGVKLFLGSSTGNMLVDNGAMLDSLFKSIKSVIAVHAEDETIIRSNKARALSKFGEGNVPMEWHSRIRSAEACVEATRHAVALAQKYDAKLHVMHVSTTAELDFLRSFATCNPRLITAETAPHYLWFTSDDYARFGSRIKCNPAIKERTDRDALIKGVAEGIISVIATDHAPHLAVQKQGDALTAVSGMPGVQYSLCVMLQLASMGHFTFETVAERMCHAPAALFGIDRRGYLRTGYYADIVVVEKNTDKDAVSDANAAGKCGWTPYAGIRFDYRVSETYINGHCAYDGVSVDAECRGRAVRFCNE